MTRTWFAEASQCSD